MKLVIVDNYDSFTFNLLQMLGEICGERPLVFKNDEVGPREIEAHRPAGVVLSPGPGHPREAGRLIEIVRDLDPAIPVLGVCLGHQAIVEAEGGEVVGAGVIVHGKTSDVTHDAGVLFRSIPSPFQATRYHSLVARPATLPATLRANAWTSDGLIMAAEHRQRPLYGVQFHPESIATGVGATILANFVDACRADEASQVERAGPSSSSIGPLLQRVLGGASLSRDVARALAEKIFSGQLTGAQVGAIAIALKNKGIVADELTGFALALRSTVAPMRTARPVLNMSSAGRHRLRTVSIAAAIVVAAAGTAVARSVDDDAPMLRDLGVATDLTLEGAARLLDDVGVAFLPMLALNPALRFVADTSELGIRTVFDVAAAVISPSPARRHVIGVTEDRVRDAVIRTLKAIGSERALVVMGHDGSDELTTFGTSRMTELRENGHILERSLDVRELGIEARTHSVERDERGDAGAVVAVLSGHRDPRREAVALNAAAALLTAGAVDDLRQGYARALDVIDSGAARALLERLRSESAKKGARG